MRILMVAANRYPHPTPVMPVGACRVAEAAERAGHRVHLLDGMFDRHLEKNLAAHLLVLRPQVVGLSIRNWDNNDMHRPVSFDAEVAALVAVIRKRSPATVVLGGPAVGLMPEHWLRCTQADVAVLGPGEEVFPRLLEALTRAADLKPLPNLAWISQNRFHQTRREPIASGLFADCPTPDFKRWLNTAAYARHHVPVPIQSKRGCPYQCVYCTYARDEGRAYQLSTPESVARSVATLEDQGFRDIEFVDNVFNAPYEHALAVSRRLGERRPKARLHTVEMNPRFIDDALLSAMEKANFAGMGITAESASDPVLEGLGKGYHRGHLEQAVRVVRRHAIPAFWIFLLGGPGETHETVEETLDFAEGALRPHDAAFFNVGIRIYPGTVLETMARKEGVIADNRSLTPPTFYVSPRINLDRLQRRLKNSLASHLNFLAYGGLRHPLLPWVLRASKVFGLQPPIWQYTTQLRWAFRTAGFHV